MNPYTGFKRRLQTGKFRYDSRMNKSQGHFILAKLDMTASKVTIIDSLNHEFHRSPYFDFPTVAQTFHDIYSSIKMKKKEEPTQLQFSQQMIQNQFASDCGLHLCANAELILRNLCPEKQTFRDEEIKKIRNYHFLLCDGTMNTFRLELVNESS